MKEKELIYKHSLANAYSHEGEANSGAVIGHVLGEKPELKKNIKELQKEIAKTVKKVNSLKKKKQEQELEKIYPEFFEEEEEENKELPELENAEKGKVVTRLPPEPNGHLHIGHAISFYFNHYYAKRYDGKLILRFEDTNPEHEKKEYYESIVKDIEWLGLEYNERKNNSDDMDFFYKYAEKLLKDGEAYACQCPVDLMRDLRFKGEPCDCRSNTIEENLEIWEKMHADMAEGSAVIRLKGNLEDKNAVMRDPTLFRIIEDPHPLQKDKYRVWPLYDFANAVEDAECGITHVLRSNEFLQREPLQNKIRTLLGLKNPEMISYSRINVEGTPTSKRKIKSMIEEGLIERWDDPRLATVKGLKRRGILPETIKELAHEVRMTSGSTTISWDQIAGINSKFVDEKADRYFFVPNPVKLEVENAPDETAELKNHPDYSKRGIRKVKTKGNFFIPKSDADKFKKGEVFRLKDLYNVKYLGKGKAEFHSKDVIKNSAKIQWVTDNYFEAEILKPTILLKDKGMKPEKLHSVHGYIEESAKKLKKGDIVQFERFGFVKIERAEEKISGILAHK